MTAPSTAPRIRHGRSPVVLLALLVAVLVVAGPADAQSPSGAGCPAGASLGSVLHECFEPNRNEDVSFAATTLDGDLPAAIQTPSGITTAPDPRKPPGADHVYSGATTDDSPDSTYEPDRDTRRPNVENYDDPFSPATAPFKRLRAYDSVDPDYSLRVRDKALKPIAVGGTVSQGDEPFYGDMSVDLLPNQPVRIPSVGPGARIVRFHANPEVQVAVLRDGADNLFVLGSERIRVRLVMEIAIPRATFGSEFADVDWSTLDAGQPQQHRHEASFLQVAQAIGISRGQRPREVVRKVVTYFRSFGPSDEPPTGKQDIYLDLALSKKGVCRHRAFAFLVTALEIGIPTRMVVNEAHAWVEVFDGTLWHRIDLGGAAANLDHEPDNGRPPYKPPPDPYSWPESHDSGQDLSDRNRERAQSNAQGPPGSAQASSASGDAGAPEPSSSPDRSAQPPNTLGPPSEVTVTAMDNDVRRGFPFHLQGRVTAGGVPCPHLRVNVLITGPKLSHGVEVGSLSTDEQGKYDGAVVISRDLALGDYDLVVATPGDTRCTAGQTK